MYRNGGPDCVDAFCKVLDGTPLEWAKQAIDEIHGSGQFPEPWSKFPAAIRTIASRLSFQHSKRREIEKATPERYRQGSKHSMLAMLGCVWDCIKAGMPTNEALATVNQRFPIADEDQPRHACLACGDTGYVRVFHVCTASAVYHGDAVIRKYSAIVICNCAAGERRHTNDEGRVIDVTYSAIYDPTRFCTWRNGDIAILRAWIDEQKHDALAVQGDLSF
jgi:hypothetical protein